MKNRFLVSGIFVAFLTIAGCESLEVYTGEDGQPHTQLTDAINTSSEIAKGIGSYVPGYGAIGGGAALILSGVANGILTILVRRNQKKNKSNEQVG